MAVNLKRLPPKHAKGVTSDSIHLNSSTSTGGIITTEAGQAPVEHDCDSAFFAERGILTCIESVARATAVAADHHTRTEAA